jgi:hypothetical protein
MFIKICSSVVLGHQHMFFGFWPRNIYPFPIVEPRLIMRIELFRTYSLTSHRGRHSPSIYIYIYKRSHREDNIQPIKTMIYFYHVFPLVSS